MFQRKQNFQKIKTWKFKNAKNTQNDEKTQDFLETFWRAKRARKNPYSFVFFWSDKNRS